MNRPGYHVTTAGFCCNCRWYRRQSQACAHDSQPPHLPPADRYGEEALDRFIELFDTWERANHVAPTGCCRDWQQEVTDAG